MAINCVEFCKALADETRQKILEMLLEREMTVGEIVEVFSTSQPTISHHLKQLKQFDLVFSRKEGKQVYYATNQDNVIYCCGQLIGKFQIEEISETIRVQDST
jgi:DNA-binding transcriptional ArsR family regulator